MDRLDAMELFVRIVEAGSFAAAAERLGVTPTRASRALRDLEDRLGARLLNRTTRRLAPTDAGWDFLARARRILGDVAEAEEEASARHARPRGPLRITAPVSYGIRRVAPLVADFLKTNPEVTVELSLNDRLVDLVEGGFDLAIRVGVPRDLSLTVRELTTARMILVASPSYLKERGRPGTPADLRDHDCLGYAHGGPPGPLTFLGRDGPVPVRPTYRMIADNGDALEEAVRAGLGVAPQPDFVVEEDLASGAVVPVLPDFRLPEFPVSALHPFTRSPPAKVRAFIDHAVAVLGRNR